MPPSGHSHSQKRTAVGLDQCGRAIHLGPPAGVQGLSHDDSIVGCAIGSNADQTRSSNDLQRSPMRHGCCQRQTHRGGRSRAGPRDRPVQRRRREEVSPPRWRDTAASRSCSRPRSTPSQVIVRRLVPATEPAPVQRLEPVQAPCQLDRVVVADVAEAIAHQGIRRQLLAETDDPACLPDLAAEVGDHRGLGAVVRARRSRGSGRRQNRTSRRASDPGAPVGAGRRRRARGAGAWPARPARANAPPARSR